jgi:hypothetical protein
VTKMDDQEQCVWLTCRQRAVRFVDSNGYQGWMCEEHSREATDALQAEDKKERGRMIMDKDEEIDFWLSVAGAMGKRLSDADLHDAFLEVAEECRIAPDQARTLILRRLKGDHL